MKKFIRRQGLRNLGRRFLMRKEARSMLAAFAVVVSVVILGIGVYGCSTSEQPLKSSSNDGSTTSSSSSGEFSQSKPLADPELFKQLFLDFPNPPGTGPAESDTSAAGGPLTGNTSLIPQEQASIARASNPTWFPTLVPSEHHDSQRTHLFEFAHFTGDFSSSDNQVLAYQSPTNLGGTIYNAVTRGPDELFVYGGGDGNFMPPNSGPFVASLNARTLEIKWKTVLENVNATGQWNVLSGVNLPEEGNLFIGHGAKLAKVDPDTGKILADISLPTGPAEPKSTNFETLVTGTDGTLFVKNQNRPVGCTQQGFNAMFECTGEKPPSVVVAVDPKTMKILDWVQLPEMIGGRNAFVEFQGHQYLYQTGTSKVVRCEWNPTTKQLSVDNSWAPSYLKEGQTQGSAPSIMGDWVIVQTNGGPAKVPLSIVAINQANDDQIVRIDPIPLGDSPVSVIPSMQSTDVENNRIYAMDFGPGKTAAITFKDGKMTRDWIVDQRTWSFTTLIGPKDQRVVVGTNIKATNPEQLKNLTYTEQIVWRNAATGAVLARSDYFDAMTAGCLVTPGYGGLIYDLQEFGGIVSMQVVPASSVTTSTPSQ